MVLSDTAGDRLVGVRGWERVREPPLRLGLEPVASSSASHIGCGSGTVTPSLATSGCASTATACTGALTQRA